MIETSSGLPRESSAIFASLRKFSENVWERSSGLRNNFGKSSEIFRRWSEIFGKSSSVCLYNKKSITLEDMSFMFSWREQYLTREILFEHKIHILSPLCAILSLFSCKTQQTISRRQDSRSYLPGYPITAQELVYVALSHR